MRIISQPRSRDRARQPARGRDLRPSLNHAKRLALALVTLALPSCTGTSHESIPGPFSVPASPTSQPAPSPTATSAYLRLIPPYGPALTCGIAEAHSNVALIVTAFRAARLRGYGAEDCLSRAALARYTDKQCSDADLQASPGPVVLYRCGSHRVGDIPVLRIEVARSDPHYVQLEVVLVARGISGARTTIYEHLTIGPGTPVGGSRPVAQVITSVSAV